MTVLDSVADSPLGKKSKWISQYQPNLLCAVSRKQQRQPLGITTQLPYVGYDVWNAYEISWLNTKGKPELAIAEFIFPYDSPNLIESKSCKLYLNSFNQTQFESEEAVLTTLEQDLSDKAGKDVQVKLTLLEHYPIQQTKKPTGVCLDALDIACDVYSVEPRFLTLENDHITETVYSNLLKLTCLVTGQPTWGSVQIHYSGRKINHEGLLKYIISYRHHDEFHEQCVERMFMDIWNHCTPKTLSIHARYNRRGGLDINPYRTNEKTLSQIENNRLDRQ